MSAPDLEALAGLVQRLGEALAAPDATAATVAEAAGGDVRDDGAPGPVHAAADLPGVDDVAVTRVWESEEPTAADIALAAPVALADLEARLGPSRALTRAPSGPREVGFGDGEGEAGWSASAALDADGAARRLSVRRD